MPGLALGVGGVGRREFAAEVLVPEVSGSGATVAELSVLVIVIAASVAVPVLAATEGVEEALNEFEVEDSELGGSESGRATFVGLADGEVDERKGRVGEGEADLGAWDEVELACVGIADEGVS